MSAKKTKYSYVEWFSAEEMHEHSKKWFSELSFIRDEQKFLKNLIQSFAIKPLNKLEFSRINDFKKAVVENRQRLNIIAKGIQKHMNQLEILMDGVNQIEMEKAYRKTHKLLYQKVNNYLLDYRTVKERGFAQLASILKTEKQKIALGNPEYKVRTVSK
jgi:sucrose-6-phosphate hydrolase SacC (GH32 family)